MTTVDEIALRLELLRLTYPRATSFEHAIGEARKLEEYATSSRGSGEDSLEPSSRPTTGKRRPA